jgi:hypothetical protein
VTNYQSLFEIVTGELQINDIALRTSETCCTAIYRHGSRTNLSLSSNLERLVTFSQFLIQSCGKVDTDDTCYTGTSAIDITKTGRRVQTLNTKQKRMPKSHEASDIATAIILGTKAPTFNFCLA